MIRKTGLIRTMQEAQALYASEIKRVKDLVNRYLPDPRVFDVSVPSQRLPDGLMVFKPAIYAKDGKTVTTEASIEIIPHVNEIYVYDQFQELDAELRLDWKLRLLEQFTEEWFYEQFSKELITAKALIQRVRKIEPTIVSDSTDASPSFGYRQAYARDNAQRLGLFDSLKMLADGLSTDRSIRNFIGAGNASALDFGSVHWDPKEFAQGYSPTISQKHEDAQKAPDTITFSTSFRESTIPIEPAPVSEPEKPFFFTDVKQLKVKKNKKKKSEKTKSSKSKRK